MPLFSPKRPSKGNSLALADESEIARLESAHAAGQPPEANEETTFLLLRRERLIALLWAAPSLVFLVFVGASLQASDAPLSIRSFGWAVVAVYVVTYIASWLLFDTDPPGDTVSWGFYYYQAFFLALHILMSVVVYQCGGTYFMHMVAYNSAVWMLQAPTRVLPVGLGVFVVVSTLENFIFDPAIQFPYGLFSATLSTYFARRSMREVRLREARQQQLLAVARQTERSRMSADLHDILGHTLTGVTLKAELAKGLLDRGRSEEASSHLTDLLELSREALGQVRSIVQDNRHMLVEEELATARNMAETAGIRFSVDGSARPPAGALSSLIARLIREGTTNAVTHSSANRIHLIFSPDGLEIHNNGYSARQSKRTRGSGTGLEGLADRCLNFGTLTWGPEDSSFGGTWWVVRLTLKEKMS